ncbi:tetratricopeptide repeat protein [Duganella sp. FT80W]|uniref:Tetratricopeptide repeat protein n=1 Tax=Duganella guangzhouensis TaxID=2666084 RepID=A0A6I2KZE6_9BURK|nr:tetratricopeptide repeat protein [Duganella guangzhouensis]MRW89636.1 tetratricopeptide repeat protein [Duganella guangzhouensis]
MDNATQGQFDESEAAYYLLEQRQAFSSSKLWDMQRAYFAERGAAAWQSGEVPHYVTSNPTIAQTYADIVFAFYQDRQRLQPSEQAMVIAELGAGSGRFAFHFLLRLEQLCADHETPISAFCYVLTDFTQANLDAWQLHPRFKPWFESGLLDCALFDVTDSDRLHLQRSDELIEVGTLQHPIVVIANYVFDGVPQDLFFLRDQVMQECLISLATKQPPQEVDVASLLRQLYIRYDYVPLTAAVYSEPVLQELLDRYRQQLPEAHMLFPACALRCLTRLQALSHHGMLLLSADKGTHDLQSVALSEAPQLSHHGSFSLSVNYHAFVAWSELQGGMALVPENRHRSIAVIALLMLAQPQQHVRTCQAYRQRISVCGPDDFYTLTKCLQPQMPEMQFVEILAYLRWTRADAHQLCAAIPRLAALAPTLSAGEVAELKRMLDRVWDAYFPLGEERDLAFDIGCLLYEVGDYRHALHYFDWSVAIYGEHGGTMFNIAACYDQLGQFPAARTVLEKLMASEPENEEARALFAALPAV